MADRTLPTPRRSLKILHLGKYFHPDPGGIESVARDIVHGTVQAGCDVEVLCLGDVESLRNEMHFGAKVTRAPIWKVIASQPLSWRYFREFQRRARDFDILQVHTPNMLAALALVLTHVRGKVIVHWHADVVDHGLLGKMLQPLERLMLRRADIIVATSQAYASASERLQEFQHKVHIVPIGISDPLKNRKRGAASGMDTVLEEMLPGDAPLILAVGRLVSYKGFEVLIDAARSLPPSSRVVIVGGGERQAELGARIDKNGVGDRVILAGRLDDNVLAALFERASIFCLPSISRAEAFGVVLLEAMAHGIPIVATDIQGSGVPWVNQDGVTGWNVPLGNSDMLAAVLIRLLAKPEQRYAMAKAARARFETEFTAEIATRRFMSLYHSLSSNAALVS